MSDTASQLLRSDEEFKKKITFKRRQGSLDWHRLVNIDLEQVVRFKDVDVLQKSIDNICYADFQAHDYEMFSEDANVIQLIRLFQLTTEYLVNVQDHLFNSRAALQNKYDQAMLDQKKLLDALEQKNAKIKALKKLIKKLMEEKKPKEVFRCDVCSAAFSSKEYLQRHIARRHETPVAPPPPPPPAPTIDSDALVRKIIDAITNESAQAQQRIKDELDALAKAMSLLSTQVSDENEDVIAELKYHIDIRAKELLDEMQKLKVAPAPVPPPAPIPTPPEPEDDKARLIQVLRSRAQLKHIWFKEFPFLKARYPAPPSDILIDKVNSTVSVANNVDKVAYNDMVREIREQKFPHHAINTAADLMVRDHYIPDAEVNEMVAHTKRARAEAHEQLVAVKERLLQRKKDQEMQRLHRVNVELREFSEARDKLSHPPVPAPVASKSGPTNFPDGTPVPPQLFSPPAYNTTAPTFTNMVTPTALSNAQLPYRPTMSPNGPVPPYPSPSNTMSLQNYSTTAMTPNNYRPAPAVPVNGQPMGSPPIMPKPAAYVQPNMGYNVNTK